MEIDRLDYLTLLFIEHLASARIESSDEHLCHALKDFIYATEVLRAMIRLQELEKAQPAQELERNEKVESRGSSHTGRSKS